MAFDPTKPANSSVISSSELRSQFTSLKTLIDTKTDPDAVINCVEANAAGPFTAVEYPNLTISNPPTQAQVQAILDKLVEILDAGRRA
jgi:hypothetical protein